MSNNDFQQNKNIPGLSFKSISPLKIFDDENLFVDDEIVGNQFIRDIKRKFSNFYSRQKSKII